MCGQTPVLGAVLIMVPKSSNVGWVSWTTSVSNLCKWMSNPHILLVHFPCVSFLLIIYYHQMCLFYLLVYYSGSGCKEFACNAGDPSLIPELGSSPREGNGNPLQYSCLESPTDRGAWWDIVRGVTKSWTDWATNTFSLLSVTPTSLLQCTFRTYLEKKFFAQSRC